MPGLRAIVDDDIFLANLIYQKAFDGFALMYDVTIDDRDASFGVL